MQEGKVNYWTKKLYFLWFLITAHCSVLFHPKGFKIYPKKKTGHILCFLGLFGFSQPVSHDISFFINSDQSLVISFLQNENCFVFRRVMFVFVSACLWYSSFFKRIFGPRCQNWVFLCLNMIKSTKKVRINLIWEKRWNTLIIYRTKWQPWLIN